MLGGAIYNLATAWTSTMSAGNGSNPRFDLVVIDSTQVPSVVQGTANANPCLPTPAQNSNYLLTKLGGRGYLGAHVSEFDRRDQHLEQADLHRCGPRSVISLVLYEHPTEREVNHC